ncbi:ribosomal protein S18 acetylase RimI-like enzyme [Nocardiopsis mwathae]|uniref:Ribosomal protein S18 acetylase RimI-like enzyme n=1 Tax=Nocardiopsis mwathae TaxID=1472723 RepID=A0A7W9YGC2_9ACTN|nr:GNAT family N-acetyltransferase [Nocardiopsis mwathae]MBB6170771.1 ribosomal protein S18 acetylase RimI-like enzyme [Nocardiopsis mwathae]
MSEQRFVRSARAEDIDRVVAVQVAAWRSMYGEKLPGPVLDELTGEEAGARFREQWLAAVQSPPTSRHRLLVATDAREVVGFASIGPSEDPDLWPGTDAEIYALHVHPDHLRRGHGSRLVNAAVDHLVDDRFHRVVIWTLEADNRLRAFAEASGWRPDGARRELEMAGATVPMIRLHAAIGE